MLLRGGAGPRLSFTAVWSTTVRSVFGDSAMPRGLVQESTFLNHSWLRLGDSRRHGGLRHCIPHRHNQPETSAAAAAAAVAADVDDGRQSQHGVFALMALFWLTSFETNVAL